jgi:hypothetical protein
MTMNKVIVQLKLVLVLVLCAQALFAQTAAEDKYNRKEVMISMRDGVKLFTVIFTPKNTDHQRLPFLITRTPYGVKGRRSPEKSSYTKDMADAGYIFVAQDIRGRYLSEGTFEMQRFSRDKSKPNSIDESSDTHTIPLSGYLTTYLITMARPACTAYLMTAGQPLSALPTPTRL